MGNTHVLITQVLGYQIIRIMAIHNWHGVKYRGLQDLISVDRYVIVKISEDIKSNISYTIHLKLTG